MSKDVPHVQLETFIFNTVFILINIYQIVRLIYRSRPPSFSPQELEIYQRTFKEVFDEVEFRNLMDIAKIDYMSMNAAQICSIGQSFKELIYVAHIHDGYSVVLEDEEGHHISKLKAGSWIGCIEYVKKGLILKHEVLGKLIKTGNLELVWQVSAHIKDSTNVIIDDEYEKADQVYQYDNKDDKKLNKGNNKVWVNELHKKDSNLKAIMEESEETKQLQFFLRNREKGCIIYRFPIDVIIFLYLGTREIIF